jgi:hypothetical protein
MRTCLPVRLESLWRMRGLRWLLRSLGTLPLVLEATECARLGHVRRDAPRFGRMYAGRGLN